jgi:alpha-tubulin suppressor-like RCC1 family protein
MTPLRFLTMSYEDLLQWLLSKHGSISDSDMTDLINHLLQIIAKLQAELTESQYNQILNAINDNDIDLADKLFFVGTTSSNAIQGQTGFSTSYTLPTILHHCWLINQFTDIKKVVCSLYDIFVLQENGNLYHFGKNFSGTCGLGYTGVNLIPVLAASNVDDVWCQHYTATSSNAWYKDKTSKKIYGAGVNIGYTLGDGTNVLRSTWVECFVATSVISEIISISSTKATHALCANGDCYCVGDNLFGQCALGYADGVTIENPTKTLLANIRAISMSLSSGSAITNDGKLYVWGRNSEGELGDNTTVQKPTPFWLNAFGGKRIVQCSGDKVISSFIAIDEDKNVWTWGNNTKGQRGNNTTFSTTANIPLKLNITNIVKVETKNSRTVVITNTGKLYVWGDTPEEIGIIDNLGTIRVPTIPHFSNVVNVKNFTMGLDWIYLQFREELNYE